MPTSRFLGQSNQSLNTTDSPTFAGVTTQETVSPASRTTHGSGASDWYSVQEVAVENGAFDGNADGWTLGSGWAYSNGKIVHTPTATDAASQNIGAVTGKTYYVTFTVSGLTAGNVAVKLGSLGVLAAANGTQTAQEVVADAATLTIEPSGDFDGAVDDIVVQVQDQGGISASEFGLVFDTVGRAYVFVSERPLQLTPIAFASLPASPVEGMMAWVNDSNTATWGATIAGGGANKVLAVFNGSVWKVAG